MADDKLDAVIIASPSEVHYEQTMACLNAGKHVLVEIPLTMSVTSSQRVAARAREVGCNVMVAHTERFIDTRCFAREFLASGEAGAVFHHQNIGWTGYQRSWVDDVVFHHGCHLVDLSLWTIDSPVRRVHGEMAPKHSVNDTSMDVSLLIRYENEAMATISLSYNARQGAGGHRYICEKGVLEYGGGGVLFAGETVFEKSVGELAAIVAQNNDFFASIREDRQPSPNADDGVRALEPLQAVYDQMREFEGDEKYMRRWQD